MVKTRRIERLQAEARELGIEGYEEMTIAKLLNALRVERKSTSEARDLMSHHTPPTTPPGTTFNIHS